jgi:hypothetical protein
MRLKSVGLIHIRVTIENGKFLKLRANFNKSLLAVIPLRVESVLGPLNAITHDGADGCPRAAFW